MSIFGGLLSSYEANIAFFLLGILVGLSSLIWSLRNQDKQAAFDFSIFCSVVILWMIVQLIEIVGGPAVALTASYAIGAIRGAMAMAWFYFCATYAGHREFVRRTPVKILAGIGGLVLVLFIGFPPLAEEYTFTGINVIQEPFVVVSFEAGTAMSQILRVIGYAFVVVGTGSLLHRLVTAGYTRNWQTLTVAASVIIVVLFDAYPEIFVPPVDGINYSAVATALVTFLYVVALYRYDLFGFVPVARDHVVDDLDDAVIVINPDGQVIDFNSEAELLMREENVTVGSDAREVLPASVVTSQLVNRHQEGRTTITIRDDEGEERYYDMNVSQLTASDTNAGIAVILRDITELRQRTKDLKQQTEQLEQFTSIVSHDLRNPLTVAQTYVMEVERHHDIDELEDVEESLERMDDIIDDALVLAREGRALEETDWYSLRDVADEAWNTSQTADAEFDNDVPEQVMVMTDASRLRTVFENLFRNSVDHGPDDVTVRMGLLPDDEGFYVEDTGPGIPEDERKNVFDEGFTTSQQGTGFGLSIVDSIAQAHDWDVDVTESDEGGARFEFTGVRVTRE